MGDTPFNELLAHIRIARGLTIKQLADKTGFTPGFVRSYEGCYKNPTVSTLYKLCVALEIQFIVDPEGISAMDIRSGRVLLNRWNPHRSYAEDKAEVDATFTAG